MSSTMVQINVVPITNAHDGGGRATLRSIPHPLQGRVPRGSDRVRQRRSSLGRSRSRSMVGQLESRRLPTMAPTLSLRGSANDRGPRQGLQDFQGPSRAQALLPSQDRREDRFSEGADGLGRSSLAECARISALATATTPKPGTLGMLIEAYRGHPRFWISLLGHAPTIRPSSTT